MGAFLDEFAFVDDHDAVGEARRGQAMGDDHRGAALEELSHALLDQAYGLHSGISEGTKSMATGHILNLIPLNFMAIIPAAGRQAQACGGFPEEATKGIAPGIQDGKAESLEQIRFAMNGLGLLRAAGGLIITRA